MKLNAPKVRTFVIALIVAVVAVVARFVPVDLIRTNAFWVMTVAYILVALGALLKGL